MSCCVAREPHTFSLRCEGCSISPLQIRRGLKACLLWVCWEGPGKVKNPFSIPSWIWALWVRGGEGLLWGEECYSHLILKFLPKFLLEIKLVGDWSDLKMKESKPPGPSLTKAKSNEGWTQSPQELGRFGSGAKSQHCPQSRTEEMLGAFGTKHSQCAIASVLLGIFWNYWLHSAE